MEQLIERTIRKHQSQKENNTYRQPLPPVTPDEWKKIVKTLGFDPGSFIKDLYVKVGAGFVGPGTIPIIDINDSEWYYSIRYYKTVRKYAPKYWPKGLLPFVDWGCAIISCVDCTSENLPVIRHDPKWVSENKTNWRENIRLEADSLFEWWEGWLDGVDLFNPIDEFRRWPKYEEIWNNAKIISKDASKQKNTSDKNHGNSIFKA